MIVSSKDAVRFWAKVNVKGPEECWPWLAGKTKFGHGIFSIKHKWVLAHRVAFFIANGYLPDVKLKRMVMHDCEFSSCQNPKHLLDGTNRQNQRYPSCIKKHKSKVGAMKGRCGKLSPRFGAKLSDKTKEKIRLGQLRYQAMKRKACATA